MQFIDLSLDRSGHHSLAQSLDAVHLGLHQTAPVIPALQLVSLGVPFMIFSAVLP